MCKAPTSCDLNWGNAGSAFTEALEVVRDDLENPQLIELLDSSDYEDSYDTLSYNLFLRSHCLLMTHLLSWGYLYIVYY